MQTQPFHVAYRSLLTTLVQSSSEEVNARTGSKIKLIEGGTSFKVDLRNGKLPIAGNRAYFPRVAAAETAWQFMGTKDPSFILSKAPKLWQNFVEDGELKTAYGWRWREAFGRDQLALAIDELQNNPTNRQIWVQAWDPRCDGLGGEQPKNIPCPLGFSLSRFGDDLHMCVFVRSSDVFVGLPYDVMAYALTLDAIAASVGCRPATLHFTLAHAHLYETHWLAAEACTVGIKGKDIDWRGISQELYKQADVDWANNCQPSLPGWSVEQVFGMPEEYISTVTRLSRRVNGSSWNPMPDVVL